jgi:taurine dioxygenase
MTITAEPQYRRITVDPLTPVIGAEISGVDLAQLDDETWAEVLDAWHRHIVVFFRDQDLTPEQHMAVGRRLGELHVHPSSPTLDGHPELMIIHADETSKYVNGGGWHTDVSCDELPPMASILHLTVTPPAGGDTLFASMYAAYEGLSPTMQEFLGGLTARHESAHVYGGLYGESEEGSRDGRFPSAVHPVVRTHPVTGRKALYVNRAFTTRINGLSRAESRALLRFLYEHQEDPAFQCRFRWAPGSVAMWDHRCAHHRAIWDYYPHTRSGLRVSVVGERPV